MPLLVFQQVLVLEQACLTQELAEMTPFPHSSLG